LDLKGDVRGGREKNPDSGFLNSKLTLRMADKNIVDMVGLLFLSTSLQNRMIRDAADLRLKPPTKGLAAW